MTTHLSSQCHMLMLVSACVTLVREHVASMSCANHPIIFAWHAFAWIVLCFYTRLLRQCQILMMVSACVTLLHAQYVLLLPQCRVLIIQSSAFAWAVLWFYTRLLRQLSHTDDGFCLRDTPTCAVHSAVTPMPRANHLIIFAWHAFAWAIPCYYAMSHANKSSQCGSFVTIPVLLLLLLLVYFFTLEGTALGTAPRYEQTCVWRNYWVRHTYPQASYNTRIQTMS